MKSNFVEADANTNTQNGEAARDGADLVNALASSENLSGLRAGLQ